MLGPQLLVECLFLLQLSSLFTPLALLLPAASATLVPVDEMDSLFHLFESTAGFAWRWKRLEAVGAVWNFTRDSSGEYVHNPCSSSGQTWQGVSCSEHPLACSQQECSITGLELFSYGLAGSLPAELGNLSSLVILELSGNRLTGTIPPEVGNMSSLVWCDISYNQLTGTIPAKMGQLKSLGSLRLQVNLLMGTIPSEIGSLVSLRFLHLSSNALTGTIPPNLGDLLLVEAFYLVSNDLTGTIPPSLGNMLSMEFFILYSNAFTGTIPPELGNLLSMEFFDLESNTFSGSVPHFLGNFIFLEYLYLDSNKLTGSLPSELGDMMSLLVFSLDSNKITGTLPPELENLLSVIYLSLSSNELIGSVLSELGNLRTLRTLNLSFNSLTGSIPATLGNLVSAEYFILHTNSLTGTIPPELGKTLLVKNILLSSNKLSGTLPSELGHLLSVEEIDVSSNALTGTLPSELGNMTSLGILNLHANQFTGNVPTELGNLLLLERLLLDSNELSGTIPAELGKLEILQILDLSSNRMSGPIPSTFGKLNNTVVLALSVNCLESKIPVSLCDMQSVEVLSLNGLGHARDCGNTVTVPWSKATILSADDDLEIPSCLWAMDTLTTLHMTGNGFVGGIDSQAFGNRLQDVSLSHNRLSGTIPRPILDIQKVDLSFNRFEGHLSVSENLNRTDLHTEVNRLSGRLSVRALETVASLGVVRGNMFSCETVPANDEDSFGYNCGSSLYNYSMYLLLASVGSLLFFLVYYGVKSSSSTEVVTMKSVISCFHLVVDEDWKGQHKSRRHAYFPLNIRDMCQRFVRHIMFLCAFLGVIVFCSAPIYLLRLFDSDHIYSSRWDTYSWTFSFGFMEGSLMGALSLVVWGCAVSTLFVYVYVYVFQPLQLSSGIATTPERKLSYESAEIIKDMGLSGWNVRTILMFLVNLCATVLVNVLFILSTTELSLSPVTSLTVRFGVSVYRVFSSVVIVPLLVGWVKDPVKNCLFYFRMLMFNNFLIPCIVTALTSSNCFQEILVEPDAIRTVYEYQACSVYLMGSNNSICGEYATSSKEVGDFVPGFAYNYQCMSVLLEAYVPVLIMGFCIQLLLPPCLVYCISDKLFGKFPSPVRSLLYGVFWPDYWYKVVSDTSLSLRVDPSELLYAPSILCADILHPLAVIMTFGLCSPPLAFLASFVGVMACCVWMWAVTRFCEFVKQAEAGMDSAERRQVHPLVSALSEVPFPLREVMIKAFWIIVAYSAVFVLFLYWDTMGEVTWQAAVAISIFVLFLNCIAHYRVRHAERSAAMGMSVTDEQPRTKDIELSEVCLNPLSGSN